MLYMYFHVSGQFSFISWAICILVGWDTLRFILEGIIVNNFSAQMILLVHPSDLILRTNVIWILKRLIFTSVKKFSNWACLRAVPWDLEKIFKMSMSEGSSLRLRKFFQDEHVWGQFLEVAKITLLRTNNRRLVQADKNKSSSQRRWVSTDRGVIAALLSTTLRPVHKSSTDDLGPPLCQVGDQES